MKKFDDFIKIVKKLREPDGCPWDIEQTFQSLTPHIIEEAYELKDAMQKEDFENLKEELGDVLLHVVMLSNMAEEKKLFSMTEVINNISEKMIHRHPHVFGDTKVKNVDEVWKNWEELKKKPTETSAMDSVPNALPALMKATKIQKRAARLGFDWKNIDEPFEKIREEINEFEHEVQNNSSEKDIKNEAGDLLFSIVNVIRKLDIDPEEALESTNQKFINRFKYIEQKSTKPLKELTLKEMDLLWEESK